MVKPKRIPTEYWGQWEDRSRTLIHHPINQRRPGAIRSAFVNQVMSVQVSVDATDWGEVTHLWIKRHDGKPVTWREMQRVKNELVGDERLGMEVYPPRSEVVDVANMYHLWVLPEGFRLPFGLDRGGDG